MENIYQIREVSTLSFNERVLQEAEDERNPLMERLRFLGIFSSNMDEFFKVRVAGIQRNIELGKKGMNAVLEVVGRKSRELDERFRDAYDGIMVSMAEKGILVLNEHDVASQPPAIKSWLRDYFRDNILPSLVPIIIHKSQPFPQIADDTVYFGVKMWGEKLRYAILEIPTDLPRFIELPNKNIMYIDDVIRRFLDEVFYIFEYERIDAFEFKISRDAQLDIDNDFSEGHVRKMERVLKQRKGGRPTRFVHDKAMPLGLLELLRKRLNIGEDDTMIGGGRYHNMRSLMSFPNDQPDLAFPPMEPAGHPVLDRSRRPIMDIIAEQDVLVTYPYQSFDHIIRLLREAAIDPQVEEIKMTLYRVAKRSQVVNALINAARNGKSVFASVELQARFDEHNNIRASEALSEAGATVVFGIPPMKVHGKLLLIKRKNQLIAGLSTGNFNENTGRLYVDSTLLTCNKQLAGDVNQVFTFLDNASKMRTLAQPKFKSLVVSPFNARKAILKLIAREKAKGTEGYIFLKINHLTDVKILGRLKAAADAGVRMDLVVRTTYAMHTHENVRAISILDRFLEHQRVYIFGKDDDAVVYMTSADLMERNLDWRIEVAFPVYDKTLRRQVMDIMQLQINDTAKARLLDDMQSNQYVPASSRALRAQVETHRYFKRLFTPPRTKPAPRAAT